jgi:hypothetical protein
MNGSPYSQAEVDFIRNIIAGKAAAAASKK